MCQAHGTLWVYESTPASSGAVWEAQRTAQKPLLVDLDELQLCTISSETGGRSTAPHNVEALRNVRVMMGGAWGAMSAQVK